MKIERTGEYTARVKCPECSESVSIKLSKNKWQDCFKAECECGWKLIIRQREIDMFQPNHPLFELYYRYKVEESKEKKRLYEKQEQQRKEELSNKYRAKDPIQHHTSKLNASEIRRLEKEILED